MVITKNQDNSIIPLTGKDGIIAESLGTFLGLAGAEEANKDNDGYGDTIEDANVDHDRNLVRPLDKCSDYDLRLSVKKLQFKATSVTVRGQRLTDKGLELDPSKVSAITKCHGLRTKLVNNAS